MERGNKTADGREFDISNIRRIRAEPSENPGKAENGVSRFLSRHPLVASIVLAVGLAAGAACDSETRPNADVEDVDAEVSDGDVEEAEIIEEADADQEETNEADVPEEADEADVGDGDVPVEAEDEGSDGDGGDSFDCTGETHTEEETVPAADRICDNPYEEGSAQDAVKTWEVTVWTGPDCTETETRELLSYEIVITPPIPESNVGCMGSDVLDLPNGQEVIVSAGADSLVTATKVGGATLSTSTSTQDWGTGEYKGRLTAIATPNDVSMTNYDSTYRPLGTINVPDTGHTPIPSVAGMEPRAYLADNIDIMGESAYISYIQTPLIERGEGSIIAYEGRNYVLHLNIVGGEYRGYVLTRE